MGRARHGQGLGQRADLGREQGARAVRAEQVGTIRLNVAVFAEMKPEIVNEKNVKLLGLVDGKVSTFTVRFGKASEAASLYDELKLRIAKLSSSSSSSSGGKTTSAPSSSSSSSAAAAPSKPSVPKDAESVAKKARSEPALPAAAPVATLPAPKLDSGASADELAVASFDEQQIAGVVTVSRMSNSALLVEASIED